MKERQIVRNVLNFSGSIEKPVERSVVREVPLTVSVNGNELITLLTTGDANRELAVGLRGTPIVSWLSGSSFPRDL
jgi:formate dehydrogenase assembly factor FdhD